MKKFKSKTKVGLISIPEVLDSNNDLDWEFLEKVEKVAVKCFKNSRYEEVYHLHNEWNNHVENILGYIALFCSETKFNLNKHELTIIVAASILHDIGKSIPYLHPSIDNKKINEDAFVLKNLEGAHHVISFIVLNKIINKEQPFENLLPDDEKQKESYNKLNELISNFQFSDDQRKYLQCAAWITLRHKKISDDLLYIFDVYLPKPKNDCSKEDAAKKKGNFLENDVKDNDQIKEINVWLNENNSKTASGNDSPDRFSVLSALLQLGDKLDITKERIREERLYLEVLLNDLVGNEVERKIHFQKQHLIEPQSLARWYQYFYVKDIDIKEKQRGDNKENSSNMKDNEKGLDITIHYTYPECIRDEFLFIRSQLEKDFEDLGILSVLERALQEEKKDEDYRITIYRSENRKEGENNDKKPQRITGLQRRSERLVYCLRKICESNNAGYDFYKEYITKKLQDCLRLADTDIKAIFECMDRKTGNPHPENCELFKAVKKFFQKDDEKSSHPDLENISIKLPENIRYLFCPDESQENEKITNYREKIEKEAILSLSPQALVGLKELKEEATKKIKKEVPGKLFYTPDGKTRFVPVSLDLTIILNLFRHLRKESLTVEDISNISGLDRGRILKYCGWLEHEGYLFLDDKAEKYKLDFENPRYFIIEKILKEFDFRHSELVSKIRDIDRFGKPLALYADLNNRRLKTNIEGLDRILSPFEPDLEGLPLRKTTLLLGTPGSGKTTLALDIVRQVRRQRLPEETALYLTFAGDIQRVAEDNVAFGWNYRDIAACVRSLSTLQSKTYLNDPDKFFKHFLNILDEFSPDLVAVDNLGYFLQLVPPEASREILNRLIRVLNVRGITSILIGEDNPGRTGFESYDTDGVIYLHYKEGQRALEITKMRGREFAGGKHPFKIKGLSEKDKLDQTKRDEPVITVFPNIHMHLEVAQRKKQLDEKDKEKNGNEKFEAEKAEQTGEDNNKKKALKSGIAGLDALLPLYSKGKDKDYGFEKGEIILVLGSPGAGKTLLGLHFLAEGFKKENKENIKNYENNEKVLWVSFESDLDGLQLATRSFSKEAGVRIFLNKMKEDRENKENKEMDTIFRFYPPAQLNPDELVNFLLKECEKDNNKKKLKRIVVDSVNDIEQAFATDMAFKTFMTSLVQLLREKEITVMFLYRTRSFFGKADDIGRVLASIVDTIICLKVLEIQNAVQKGLFLLKVRGREHQSRLLSLDFNEKEGMSVFDRGWTMSGLISGEAGEIKEPRVSVKLFFENSNEFLINALIVKEYNRRFKGGQTTFVHVRKPQIYSEFWSFRGSSGAGHSNVRVLSLCDYWAAHFQRQGKLCELSEYVTATTFQLVHREEFWRRCAFYSFEKNAFEIFSIPNYVDIGVLAYHKSLKQLAGFWDSLNIENAIENWETLDIKERLTYLTWNKLDPIKNPKITKAIQAINKTKHSPRYLFAMPSLEEKASFVSFFLELFWSFGGVIFDLRNLFNEYANHCLVNKDKPEKEKEFFNSPKIVLSSDLQFVAEILMLIPERILNKAICSMNWEFPNFLSDISRHAEVLLDKLLKDTETTQSEKNFSIQVQKKSAITEIDDPLKSFFDLYSKKKRCPITDFLVKLREVLANDDIWEGNRNNILAALKNTKKIVAGMMKIKENGEKEKNKKIKNEKEHILIILYFVISRIITNRERYQKLLKWHLDLEKEKDTVKKYEYLSKIIIIGPAPENKENGDAKKAAEETFEFLFQLVKSGIAPNPHRGDFTDDAYLARKWSGDIAPRPKLPKSEGIIAALDLNTPSDAYEYMDNEKTLYKIAPLPFYEREKLNNKTPGEKWSYAVMGLWSLGITQPALSPEIGWIFIDALTEDKFVEMRAKKGLGLPAKVSAYERESIRKAQPDIYGAPDAKGKIKGIVDYYELASQDKARKEAQEDNQKDIIRRRTRERASIPYYYQIEEFLIKELSRFFEPSFFDTLAEKEKDKRGVIINDVLKRIHNRIKNFLIKEFELDERKNS